MLGKNLRKNAFKCCVMGNFLSHHGDLLGDGCNSVVYTF